MDLGRIALLFVVPPFLLGWLADKVGIHTGPNAITKAIVFVSLAAGTVFTIAAWIRHSPDRNARFLATLLFGALDVYLALPFVIAVFAR